ncbi:MAG: helix-turn-helix domain-containing protein [Herbinix sp.]|nr:helix-turn-helix domain-containing protein [Herbinix sp.]
MFEQYNDIVNLDEMAEMLGIGRNHAYQLLKSGQVKSFKNGRSWRIPKLAVIEYILNSTGIKLK